MLSDVLRFDRISAMVDPYDPENRERGIERATYVMADKLLSFCERNYDSRALSFRPVLRAMLDKEFSKRWSPHILPSHHETDEEKFQKLKPYLFMIKNEDRIIALGGYEIVDKHIEKSFTIVDKNAKMNGYGSEIMDAKIKTAIEMGCEKYTTMVGETNTPSRRMLEKSGFKPTGEFTWVNGNKVLEYALDLGMYKRKRKKKN